MRLPVRSCPAKPQDRPRARRGSARGWAHIGVLRALDAAGIRPDLVCGTSIGALVGAAWAASELDSFASWVLAMRVKDVVSFMDLGFSGGFLKGERLMEFVRRSFVDRPIEELPVPFGAVATALHTGAKVWLRSGSTVDAVRASIALPALFTPVVRDGVMLVDGGIVNPVPVSLARAMAPSCDRGRPQLRPSRPPPAPRCSPVAGVEPARRLAPQAARGPRPRGVRDEQATHAVDARRGRVEPEHHAGAGRAQPSRRRPGGVIVAPRLAHLGLLDFHRGEEAIAEGARAVESALPSLRALGLA